MRWLDGVTNSRDMGLKIVETVKAREAGVLQSMGSQRVGRDLVTEQSLESLLQRQGLEPGKQFPFLGQPQDRHPHATRRP